MPGGSTWLLMWLIFSRTLPNTSVAFSPRRKKMMPSTSSGLSSNWNTPNRGAWLILTSAISPMRIGMPLFVATTTCLISWIFFSNPTPRTTNCCSPLGNSPPPVFAFEVDKAVTNCESVTPFACIFSGRITTWYCLTLPPKEDTSATPGVCFNSL